MNTKERILNCSLDLFSKKGYSNISVRDIAREVGVRESALYKHYKNNYDFKLKHITYEEIEERINHQGEMFSDE